MATQSDTPSGSASDGPAGSGSSAGAEPLPPLSKDTIFELLKNQRRRYVLQYLAEDPGPVRLRDLAERIAAWENDKPIAALDSDERKRVYVGLYQAHLTKMDDAGVVEFNQDRGIVTRGERASVLYEYLDPFGGGDPGTWSFAYLGLSLASGVFALFVDAGLLALPQGLVTVVVIAVFFVVALLHAATASLLDIASPSAALDALSNALANDRS